MKIKKIEFLELTQNMCTSLYLNQYVMWQKRVDEFFESAYCYSFLFMFFGYEMIVAHVFFFCLFGYQSSHIQCNVWNLVPLEFWKFSRHFYGPWEYTTWNIVFYLLNIALCINFIYKQDMEGWGQSGWQHFLPRRPTSSASYLGPCTECF